MESLKGKKGLIIGIANEHSIAWGCDREPRDTALFPLFGYRTFDCELILECKHLLT